MSPPMQVFLSALSFLSLLSPALGNDYTPPASEPAVTTRATVWQPTAGSSWQIVLEYPLNSTSCDASVYDIDMFDNPAYTLPML
jgi:hypothetical protein